MTRASDFWIADRRHDLELGGMSLTLQRELFAELEASRARERELEAKLAEPGTLWSQETAKRVAQLASAQLPVGKQYLGGLNSAVDRAIAVAIANTGLIGDHPGLRTSAKVLLVRMREDFRAPLTHTATEGDRP